MSVPFPNLDQFSPRGLNLLGSIFSGSDVRVVLSTRATHPATVVLESRTVVLDPARAGLYDLALCARMLQHRSLRRTGPKDKARLDAWLTKKIQSKLAPQTQKELRSEFPGIERLPGLYRPDNESLEGFNGLQMVSKSIDWKPLEAPKGPLGSNSLSFESIPEIELTGTEDDYGWLLNALQSGNIPLETLPGLEDLPFVRVPFRICLSEGASPTLEVFERKMAEHEIKDLVASLMGCYRRKSEVREERLNLGKHTRHGVRFDTNRLVEAIVSSRAGIEPKLFKRKAGVIEPVFNPQEHLVLIEIDLNDLRRTDSWWETEQNRSSVQRFLSCMIMAYQKLEVDCIVRGFADRLVTLDDGRAVCLHWSTELKSIDDHFDVTFWNRVTHLFDHPPQFPGESTCFHPLSLHDISTAFDRTVREQDHSYRALIWWARHGMSHDFPQFHTADFLMRTADHVDREVLGLEKRLTGTFDTLATYLPKELKSHGRPGQFLEGNQMGRDD